MSYFTKRSARIVAGSLAGALALSVTPIMGLTGIASAADALPPLADPIGAGNFCENAPTTEPFTDVSATDPAIDEIICLVATELTKGTTATTYSPNLSITRRQMALFIKRTADLANELDAGTNIAPLPAYDGVPDFLDIAGESTEVKEAIGQLAQADIVQGTSATTYSPRANVSRRQMAAFINRLQDFLTGDPFTTTGDFFNDDAGDTGEANLNAVASVGIFQGDGAGNVDPGGDLTRRQMAFVLLRHLQVNFDAGDIDGPFAPSTNQSFTATPSGDQVVALGAGGTGGTKDVTFSGLGTTAVDVALVPCFDDEIQDDAGLVSFLDQDEDNVYDVVSGSGSTFTGNAALISINSEPVGSTTFDDAAAPVGGSVVVRVRSTDVDCARILVFADDGDDELDLDAANQPTEAFGVSDMIVWHNGEAPDGTDPHDYIVYIDKAADFFVLEDGFLYEYDSSDIFGNNDVDLENQISLAQFELAANINDGDDEIDMQSVFGYSSTDQNRYALDHEVSNIPTGLTAGTSGDLDGDADASDTPFAWSAPDPVNGLIADYTVDVYTDAAQVDCDSGVFVGSTSTANAVTTATYEDLGDGAFCALVYATTVDGNNSYYSEPIRFTVDTGQAPIITSAVLTADAVTTGAADTGDVWTLVFDEEMDPTTVAGATFSLTDADGDSILVSCTAAAADTITDATCVLGDGASATVLNDTLVITLAEAATDRNLGGNNVDIAYPLTITASTGLTDLNNGDAVNVAGSTDKVVG